MFCSMRTLSICLIGTSPLLLHRTSKHQLRDQIAADLCAGRTLEDEALEVMQKDAFGNPAVPVSWLSDAIRVGCSRITVEGKQLSFVRISSCLRFSEGCTKLQTVNGKKPTWEVYRSIQHLAPGSKRTIAVIAPMFKDWMLSFQVKVDGSFPDDALIGRILAEAGRVGIGLFHPPKKHFGQFRARPRTVACRAVR